MGIDHGGFAVPTGIFEEAKAFYLAALEPLGYSVQYSYGPYVIGLGDTPHAADFWLAGNDEKGKKRENGKGEHIAFRAKDKETVDAFHAAAVKAGGTCNGPPGPRPQYHAGYYGAFVFDPAGNNVEAVIHTYQSADGSSSKD